jgi:hypothetical protein
MRTLILPNSASTALVACAVLTIALILGLGPQNYNPPLLLRFVPPLDQQTYLPPQEKPSISSEEAVRKALEFNPSADEAAVNQVVVVHVSNPDVDPPYDDALAWAVNFDPSWFTDPATYPVIYSYVLVDAQSGEPLFSAQGGGMPKGAW